MLFELIWWAFCVVAVLGTLYVSILKKVRSGHVLWIISNVGLIACNAHTRAWPMVALFMVYLLISIVGFFRWQFDNKGGTNEASSTA